jgi:fatty acid CoA ligase FadD36
VGLLRALDGDFDDHADAVVVGAERSSWTALRTAASAIAAQIAGEPAVAIKAEPTLATIVGIVGGLLAGVPVVPLPADAGPDETAYILGDSGASLLLVPPDVVDLGTRPVTHNPATTMVLYTSGTTGPPKGVQISAAAIAADLDALAEAWAWTPADKLVHGLPLYHVHGLVLGILGPLRLGSRLHHTVRPTPEAYAGAGGSLYFGVPTVWSRVCSSPSAARKLASARLLVSGSAPLPLPVFAALEELTGLVPIERYGMTETLITCSTRVDGTRVAGSVGLPVAGVRTRLAALLDPSLDSSGLGELQIAGPTLFGGYLGLCSATSAAFTDDGWFRTGDIATVDDHGMHRIVGRASLDLIKTGGYRVGAGEVEDALLAHPGVAEAAVVGAPHADLGQEIVAFVVGSGVNADELISFATERLAWHKRPRRVILVEQLPRNAMGKVQKRALLD